MAGDAEGVTYVGVQNGKAVYELVSGNYSFSMVIDPNEAVLRNVRIAAPQGVSAKAIVKGQEYALPMNEMISGSAGEIEIVSNDPNFAFAYWGGGIYDTNPVRTLPSGEEVALEAYFQYIGGESEEGMLTLSLEGEEGASVRINGEAYPLPFSGSFEKGTELVIDPVAPEGKTFAGWEGGKLAGNPAAVTLNEDISAAALFDEVEFDGNLAIGKPRPPTATSQ